MGATFFTRPGEWEELVSIHAPVWVRPFFIHRYYLTPAVSIHAPVWVRLPIPPSPPPGKRFQFTHPCGCDEGPCRRRRRGKCFNSRTRVGATITPTGEVETIMVSIHAPVWVRQIPRKLRNPHYRFQFTHPCGCDPQDQEGQSRQSGFNSRTRVGATFNSLKNLLKNEVSIHAPVWVRLSLTEQNGRILRFQFTHPCGCDPTLKKLSISVKRFNSRTRVGATISA